jgi:hypothetical protein
MPTPFRSQLIGAADYLTCFIDQALGQFIVGLFIPAQFIVNLSISNGNVGKERTPVPIPKELN